MNFTIRRANENDFPLFEQMYACLNDLHAAQHPGLFQSVQPPIHMPEYFSELLDDHWSALFFAEVGSDPAGFILMKLRTNYELSIMTPRLYAVVDSVYVHPQYRRQGIGKALMEAGEEWAIDQGVNSLDLNVYDFNETAIELYKKMGYRVISYKMMKWLE